MTRVCADQRAWTRGLFTELARDAGAANPRRLGEQLVVLYDGATVGASMDGGSAATRTAREMAEVLLDAQTSGVPARQARRQLQEVTPPAALGRKAPVRPAVRAENLCMADTKQDVLDMLRELAELTMLEEGDPQSFRVRAYESAAQAIAAQATDLGKLTVKELQKIEGIGKSTAEKIRELIETGKVAKLEALRAEAPAQRGRAAAHPGPRAQGAASGCAPSSACSRSTICARALAEHKLRELKGFGQKSEEKLAAVAGAPRGAGRGRADAHLGGAAAREPHRARACCEVPGVTHASYCGSLRRFSETIGDVDIVVAATDAGPVMEALVRA